MPVFQGVFGMGYSKRRALPYVVKLKAYSQELKEQVEAKDARLQEVGYKNY